MCCMISIDVWFSFTSNSIPYSVTFKKPFFYPSTLHIHPSKLTCPQKRDYFSREYIFQPLIFRGHVSFQGSKTILDVYLQHNRQRHCEETQVGRECQAWKMVGPRLRTKAPENPEIVCYMLQVTSWWDVIGQWLVRSIWISGFVCVFLFKDLVSCQCDPWFEADNGVWVSEAADWGRPVQNGSLGFWQKGTL